MRRDTAPYIFYNSRTCILKSGEMGNGRGGRADGGGEERGRDEHIDFSLVKPEGLAGRREDEKRVKSDAAFELFNVSPVSRLRIARANCGRVFSFRAASICVDSKRDVSLPSPFPLRRFPASIAERAASPTPATRRTLSQFPSHPASSLPVEDWIAKLRVSESSARFQAIRGLVARLRRATRHVVISTCGVQANRSISTCVRT